jgi:hypothetical protein
VDLLQEVARTAHDLLSEVCPPWPEIAMPDEQISDHITPLSQEAAALMRRVGRSGVSSA